MTKKTKISELPDFDPAEYLDNEEAIAEYLTAIITENNPGLLAAALGDVAKARGMTDIAKASGHQSGLPGAGRALGGAAGLITEFAAPPRSSPTAPPW